MQAQSDKRACEASVRPTCKSAAVCPDEPWRDLLKPNRTPAAEPRPASPDNNPAEQTESILFAVAQAVEQRDHHTGGHCERLALISVVLGVAMRLERSSLVTLYRSGFLHDVGKVGLPDSILLKPASLDAEEWAIMRSHPSRGVEICRHLQSLAPVLPVIRHHHERWDGSGYPDGLRGQQIPLLARVLQVADIYDALTNPRPYKPAFETAKALEIMAQETDRGWRDPEIVALFMRLHDDVISRFTGPDRNLESLRMALVERVM